MVLDYSKFEGIEDSDEETARTTEPVQLGTTREAGNELFRQKKYAEAIATYSMLLDDADAPEKTLLLCNRSACLLMVDDVLRAARDAKEATALQPKSAKAWYRLATAELKRGQFKNARIAAAKALGLEDSAATRALLKKAKASGLGDLYGDRVAAPKPAPTVMERQARDAQLALERLRRMARDAGEGGAAALQDAHGMCVYFTKLASSPADFREMVFPGEPPGAFHSLPGTLQAFLNDARYAPSIKKRWPTVLAKAHAVLQGAKQQGKDAGETMPTEVEQTLWPQIVAEAYAREFQECAAEGVAVPTAAPPVVSVDALPRQACRALSLDADASTWGGVACVVPKFLGADWHAAVADDVARLIDESRRATDGKKKRLQQLVCDGATPGALASQGAVAWLDPSELDADFPALAELATRLRGLPEALAWAAASAPDQRVVRPLLEPAFPAEWQACSALAPPTRGPQLFVLEPDHVVDRDLFRCDGDGEGAKPLISALYFVDGGDPRAHLVDSDPAAKVCATRGGDLVLKRAPDGDFAHLGPEPDALVLWRSKLAYHAREPVRRGRRAVIRHWVFAAPDVLERNLPEAV